MAQWLASNQPPHVPGAGQLLPQKHPNYFWPEQCILLLNKTSPKQPNYCNYLFTCLLAPLISPRMSFHPNTAHQSQPSPSHYRQWRASSSQKIHHTRVSPNSQSLSSRSLIKCSQYQLPKLYLNGRAKLCLTILFQDFCCGWKAKGCPAHAKIWRGCGAPATTPQSPQGHGPE